MNHTPANRWPWHHAAIGCALLARVAGSLANSAAIRVALLNQPTTIGVRIFEMERKMVSMFLNPATLPADLSSSYSYWSGNLARHFLASSAATRAIGFGTD